MKTLFVILILALALGAGYWKTQHPEVPITALPNSASSALSRLGDGFQAIRDGSDDRIAEVEAATAERARLSNRIDKLSRGISNNTGVSSTASTSALPDSSEIAAMVDQRVASVETRLDQALQNINRRATLAATAAAAAASDSQNETQDTSAITAAVEERIASVEQRIDQVVRNIDKRLDEEIGLRTEAEGELRSILSDLEGALGSVESRTDTLSSGLAEAGSEGSGNAAALSAVIDSRLTEMEARIGGAADSSRLEFIVGQLEENAELLDTLKQRQDDTQSLIGSLNDRLDELTTRTESTRIDDQQADIRQQLANLESQLSASDEQTNVSDFNESLESSRERIRVLEQRLQELPVTSTAADEALKAQIDLEAQIATLTKQIEGMPNQVKKEVNQLASDSFVTREELAKQKAGKNREYKIYFDRNSTVV